MLEGILANLLKKYLGDYVLGISDENIKLAVGNGLINFTNLEINPESLLEFNLPITIKKGTLGLMNIKFPWSNLSGESTIIQIEDLYLLLAPKMNEYDENLEAKIKEKRLKVNEMIKSDEEVESEGWTDSLMSGISEKVMNNLEIEITRIHIRYEDDSSNKENPFSFGITLDHLLAKSADENWEPAFLTSSSPTSRKIVELKNLSVYLDHNNKPTDLQSLANFSDLFQMENKTHCYILEPVNGSLKVTLNNSKQKNEEEQIPKMMFDFLFETITISLNELQYKDLMFAAEYLTSLVNNQKYKHLRPKEDYNTKRNYKIWWYYAVDSVLQDIKEQKKFWRWNFLKQHMSDRRHYVDLWYRKRAGLDYDEDLLNEIEDRSNYETIISFRKLGDAFYQGQKLKSEQEAKELNSKKSFLGKLFFSAKPKLEEEVEISSEVMKDLQHKVDEDKVVGSDLPDDYVQTKVDFQIKNVTLRILEAKGNQQAASSLNQNQQQENYLNQNQQEFSPRGYQQEPPSLQQRDPSIKIQQSITDVQVQDFEPILEVRLDSFYLSSKLRQKSMSLYGYLQSFSALDYATLDGKPFEAISSFEKEKKQIELEYHSKPLKHPYNADTKILLKALPVNYFFSMKLINRVSSFFSSPISENSLIVSSISSFSADAVESLQRQARAEMKSALSSYSPKLDIMMVIYAPKIYIPQDFTDLNKQKFLIDLGRLTVSSDLESSQKPSEGENNVSLDYFYDKFDISLSDMKVSLIGNPEVIENKEPEILTPFDLKISVRVLNNPVNTLPKIKITSQLLTPLTIGLSPNIINHFLRFLDTFPPAETPEESNSTNKLKSFEAMEIRKKKLQQEKRSHKRFMDQKKDPNYLANLIDKEEEKDSELLEKLKENTDDIQEELSDPNNPNQISFTFEVPKIKLDLYSTKDMDPKKLISCNLNNLDMKLDLNEHNTTVEASICSFCVKDKVQKHGEDFKRVVDSKVDNFQNTELVHLRYEYIAQNSQIFEGIENNASVSFGGLSLMVNRETVVYLLNFFDEVDTKSSSPEEKKQQKKQQEGRGSRKSLLIRNDEEEFNSTFLKVELNFGILKGSLNGEGVRSFLFSVRSSKAFVESKTDGTFAVSSKLGQINFVDALEKGQYSQMITTKESETMYVNYSTNTQGEKTDSKLDVNVNPIQVTFLNKSVDNLINYFAELDEIKILLSNSIKKTTKYTMERKESSMKVDLLIRNPYLLVPKRSTSKMYAVFDLGNVSVVTFDRKRKGKPVNVFEIEFSDMNITTNDEHNLPIVENTTIRATIERVIDVSFHDIPSTYISSLMTNLKLNISDSSLKMVSGILSGNLCEMEDKSDNIKQRQVPQLIDKADVEYEEDLNAEKEKTNDIWDTLLVEFSFEQLSVSLLKNRCVNYSSCLNFATIDVNKLDFQLKCRSDDTMEVNASLNELLYFDKETNNSKFPKLFSPIYQSGEKNLIVANMTSDPAGNMNLLLAVEDMNIYLLAQPIWSLYSWIFPLSLDILNSYDKWILSTEKEKIEKKEEKGQEVDKEKINKSLDTKFLMDLKIKRPQIIAVEDEQNEFSDALFLDSEIEMLYESSRSIGSNFQLYIERLSVSKFSVNQNSEPSLLIEPYTIKISYGCLKEFTKWLIETENMMAVLTYQDYLFLQRIQQSWTKQISAQDQQQLPPKEEVEEKVEQKLDNKETVTTIATKLGSMQLTLMDDILHKSKPIVSIKANYLNSDISFKEQGSIKGAVDVSLKVDFFNSKNQNWEPLLRSFKRESSVITEGCWEINTSFNKPSLKLPMETELNSGTHLNANISKELLTTFVRLSETLSSPNAKVASTSHTMETRYINNSHFYQFFVRNETGEDIQFWVTGTDKLSNVPTAQESYDFPIPIETENNVDDKKKVFDNKSINFRLLTSNKEIRELSFHAFQPLFIPINPHQTIIYEVVYQNGNTVCTLKSNFTLENSTDFTLRLAYKEGYSIQPILDFSLKPGNSYTIPLRYCERSIVVSRDPERYGWSEPINFFEISRVQDKILNQLSKSKPKEQKLHKLSENLERILSCAPLKTAIVDYPKQENILIETNNPYIEEKQDIDEQRMVESHVETKPYLPYFLSLKILPENDFQNKYSRFKLTFRPPFVLSNLLPVPVKFCIHNFKKSHALDEGEIARGDKLSLYSFDTRSKEYGLSVKLKGFEESIVATVSGDTKDLSTLLPLYESSDTNKMKKPVLISLDHKVENCSSEVSLYVNYWIINKSNLPLLFMNPSIGEHGMYLAGQKKKYLTWDIESKGNDPYYWFERNKVNIEEMSVPLMYNSDTLKVRVGKSDWSDEITLSNHIDQGLLEMTDGVRLFVFSLAISPAPDHYWRTNVLKLRNKYCLVNSCQKTIQYKQSSTEQVFFLKPGEQTYFHWPNKDAAKTICIKYDGDQYTSFSGPFNLTDVSFFECKILNLSRGDQVNSSAVGEERIAVQTTTNQNTTAVIFKDEREQPMYILRNNTKLRFEVKQKDSATDHNRPTILTPNSQIAFAWSEPCLDNKMVTLKVKDTFPEEYQHYSLDEVTSDMSVMQVSTVNKKSLKKELYIQPRVYFEGITRVFEIRKVRSTEPIDSQRSSVDTKQKISPYMNFETNKVSTALKISLPGFSLSIMDGKPQEIMNMTLEGIFVDFRTGDRETTVEAKIKYLQIDNQLFNTPFPVVLVPVLPDKETDFFYLSLNKCNLHKNITFFNGMQVHLQQFDLFLDEAFVTHMFQTFSELFQFYSQQQSHEDLYQDKQIEYANKDVSDLLYFKTLWIGPLMVNLSYSGCHWAAKDIPGSNVDRILDIVGKISDIDNSPIRLNSIEMSNMLFTSTELMASIQNYYTINLARQFYMLLGSFNFLGNPVNLVHSLGEGVRDFFYEPAKGFRASPEKFGEGMYKGTTSLFKNTVSGVFGTTQNLTSTLGNMTSLLSMDRDYIEERQLKQKKQAKHAGEGIMMGAQDLSSGVVKGFTGLFTQPIKGAQVEGGKGFLKGLGKGITGVITKPVTGVVDLTSRIGQGIKNTASNNNSLKSRMRSPRYIDSSGVLRDYNYNQSEGQEILLNLKDGIYKNEHYLFHYPNLQSVNDGRFILASNNHIFSLKGNDFAKMKTDWSVEYKDIKSIKHSNRGVDILALKKRSIFGLQLKNSEKEVSYSIPADENTSLYIYYHLMEIVEDLQDPQKKVVPITLATGSKNL